MLDKLPQRRCCADGESQGQRGSPQTAECSMNFLVSGRAVATCEPSIASIPSTRGMAVGGRIEPDFSSQAELFKFRSCRLFVVSNVTLPIGFPFRGLLGVEKENELFWYTQSVELLRW